MKTYTNRMKTENVFRAILVVQQNLTPFARTCISEISSKFHLEVFQVIIFTFVLLLERVCCPWYLIGVGMITVLFLVISTISRNGLLGLLIFQRFFQPNNLIYLIQKFCPLVWMSLDWVVDSSSVGNAPWLFKKLVGSNVLNVDSNGIAMIYDVVSGWYPFSFVFAIFILNMMMVEWPGPWFASTWFGVAIPQGHLLGE